MQFLELFPHYAGRAKLLRVKILPRITNAGWYTSCSSIGGVCIKCYTTGMQHWIYWAVPVSRNTLRHEAHSYLLLPCFVLFGSLSNTLTADISRTTMCTWATIGKFSWAPLIFIRGPLKCYWVRTALHPPFAPASHHMLLEGPFRQQGILISRVQIQQPVNRELERGFHD